MKFFLLAFPALLSIINPLGGAFVFMSATRHLPPEMRARVARWVLYRFSDRMARFFGPTGTTIVVRLTAFLLFCIGIQVFWSGADELLEGLLRK